MSFFGCLALAMLTRYNGHLCSVHPDAGVEERSLAPVESTIGGFNRYTQPDPDLFIGDDVDANMSPLAWLRSGGDVKRAAMLARRL